MSTSGGPGRGHDHALRLPPPGSRSDPRRRRALRAPATPARLADFTVTPRMLGIAALAVVTGLASALLALALLRLIGLVTHLLFFQEFGTSLVLPAAADVSPAMILLIPIAGGLVVGLMARYGSEKIRGHGMPETIESILTGGSKVQPRVAVLKPLSAAVSIGSGGPFGAEGPIIMTGGAVGSIIAQFLKLTADERKTLLVAGAAGGMAATFNTPLAATLIAAELLLFEWRPRSLVPVAVSVVAATVTRGYLLGTGPLFDIPEHVLHLGLSAYAACIGAGLAGGLLATGLTALVYASEDTFVRLPVHWMWWPAVGGLIIGLGGLIVPEALGVGYVMLRELLAGELALSFVVGLLVVKSLIWALSLGSGTSGGILAPLFIIGGALGALEATVLPDVAPGFWVLIGLGAALAGTMRTPFLGVVFPLELTHEWAAMFPLLIASFAGYALSALVLKRSILTEKVARRGYHLTREYNVDPLEVVFVREVMDTDQRPLGLEAAVVIAHPDETLRTVACRMATHEVTRMPVIADDGHCLGTVHLDHLLAGRLRDVEEERVSERVLRVPAVRRRARSDQYSDQLTGSASG